jgi:hypothetical protein
VANQTGSRRDVCSHTNQIHPGYDLWPARAQAGVSRSLIEHITCLFVTDLDRSAVSVVSAESSVSLVATAWVVRVAITARSVRM